MIALTNTEFKVYMLLVGRAMSTKNIAVELKTTTQTVKNLKYAICNKLGAGTSLELLVQYHHREGNI